jgi:hypothetical protein
MIWAFVILQTLVFSFILVKLFNKNKKEIIEDFKKEHFVLEKPKTVPSFSDFDKNHQLLLDIIESAKLENWKVTNFQIEGLRECYDIQLKIQ